MRNSKVDFTDSARNENSNGILIDNVIKCNIRRKEKKRKRCHLLVTYIIIVRVFDVPKIGLSY